MDTCQAQTTSGRPCKNKPKDGCEGYCAMHFPLRHSPAPDTDDENGAAKPNDFTDDALRAHRKLKRLAVMLTALGTVVLAVVFLEPPTGLIFSITGVSGTLGAALVTSGLLLFVRISTRYTRPLARFIDVDERTRASSTDRLTEVLSELEKLRETHGAVDYNRIYRIATATESRKSNKRQRHAELESFSLYFQSVVRTLQEKAAVADEKASMLLDKGTSYSRGGIVFFLISIIVWQTLTWIVGYKPEFVYGVLSTSFLFAFIEFLSAWFLRQYRHFVDTSTYLIKVKSLFDRYLLAYLIAKESEDAARKDSIASVLAMLGAEMKWPDMKLLKRGDVNFAREAMEAMSSMAQLLKGKSIAETKKTG